MTTINGAFEVVSVTHRPLDPLTAERLANTRRREWQAAWDRRMMELQARQQQNNPFMHHAGDAAWFAYMAAAQAQTRRQYSYNDNAMKRQAEEARKRQEEAIAAAQARHEQEKHNMRKAHEAQRDALEAAAKKIKEEQGLHWENLKKTLNL